jgi:WD40 repeat protein
MLLAFGMPGGEVIIWDRAGGVQRARARVAPQGLLAVAFAPDSQSLAVCGELDGTIGVLDTLTGHPHWTANLGHGATTSLAYSPDGKTLVASHGSALSFLDAATGEPHHAH